MCVTGFVPLPFPCLGSLSLAFPMMGASDIRDSGTSTASSPSGQDRSVTSAPSPSPAGVPQACTPAPASTRDTPGQASSAKPPAAPRRPVAQGVGISAETAGLQGNDGGLSAAAASGSFEACRRILARGLTGPCACGPDGTTALCAAALWGHADVARLLLDSAADPGQQNRSGTGPTALHAAALQEHGKVCMVLLEARADPHVADKNGVSPNDYASCSEAVWPLFAAAGCLRARKEDLISKGVIRKASNALENELEAMARREEGDDAPVGGNRGLLPEFSRPGSAYVFTAHNPPRPGSSASLGASRRPGSRASSVGGNSRPGSRPVAAGPIDILAEGDEAAPSVSRATDVALDGTARSLRSLGL